MPSLSFSRQFADDVEAGRKLQTIRLARKRPIHPGDRLYHYTGMRTKECRKLGEAVCSEVHHFVREKRGKWWLIDIENEWGRMEREEYITEGDVCMMARRDGFETTAEFEDWFDRYGEDARLDLIKWPRIAEGEA